MSYSRNFHRQQPTFRIGMRYSGEAIDTYLASIGLFRKPTANDDSSLFRAVSEQLYLSQRYFEELQQITDDYVKRHAEKFSGMDVVDSHLKALSELFDREIFVFGLGQKEPINVSKRNCVRKIALCESAGRHFDSVYPKPHQYKAAICQSIVYEILYRDVFGFDKEIDLSVHLLRSRAFPADSPRGEYGQSAYSMAFESEFESSTEVFGSGGGGSLARPGMIQDEAALRKHLIQYGPPFPYKVVKALDPVIYRNMEFDVWLDSRRRINRSRRNDVRQCRYRPGDHCLAKLSLYNNGEQLYSVIVQELKYEDEHGHLARSLDHCQMVVYCEENGQQLLVPYSTLMDKPGAYYHVEDASVRGRSRSFGERSTASGLSKSKPRAIAAHSFEMNSGVESGESDEMSNSNTTPVAPKAPTPDPYYSYYEQSPQQQQQASFDGEDPAANAYVPEYPGVSESLPSGMIPVDPSFYIPFGNSLPSSAYVYPNQMNMIPHYPVPQQSVETVTGYPIMQQYNGDPNAGGMGMFQAVPPFNALPLQALPPPPPVQYQASYDDGFEIPPGFFPAFGSTPGNESSGYGGEFYSSGEQTDCSGTTNGVHRNRKAPDRSPTEQAGYRQMHVGGHSLQPQPLQSSPKAIPLASFEGRRMGPPQCGPPTAPAPTPLFPKPVPYFPVISVPFFDNGLASFVNYNATVSQDPHGNDMPFNDLLTLRFFYNMGIEYFRQLTMHRMQHCAPPAPPIVSRQGSRGGSGSNSVNSNMAATAPHSIAYSNGGGAVPVEPQPLEGSAPPSTRNQPRAPGCAKQNSSIPRFRQRHR